MILGVALRKVRSFCAIGALVSAAACSGAGAGGGGPISSLPAASNDLAPQSIAVSKTSSIAFTAPATTVDDDVTPADVAAIGVPLDTDLSAEDVASSAVEYNWNLTGDYHGIIKAWVGGKPKRGNLRLSVTRSGRDFSGSGVATSDGNSADITISGSIVATYEHSIALSMDGYYNGCAATGSARRYPHVFEGVLKSPGCGFNPVPATYYFKVHPNP